MAGSSAPAASRPAGRSTLRSTAACAASARTRRRGVGAGPPADGRPWGGRVVPPPIVRRTPLHATEPRHSKQGAATPQQPDNGPGWEWDKESISDEDSPYPWSRLFPKREKKKPYFIREWLSEADPGLNQSLISSGTTISQLFDQDKWENHRSMKRYFRELKLMPQSTVLRRIAKPCTSVAAVSRRRPAFSYAGGA
eukprot:jgi/Tetstr1/446600/TSEL_034124.t1